MGKRSQRPSTGAAREAASAGDQDEHAGYEPPHQREP